MPRYTLLQRRRLVRQFHASGLTLASFCRQHSLSVSNLCTWRRHIDVHESSPKPASPQWLPVDLPAQPQPPAPAPGGYVIEAGPCRLSIPSGFLRDEVAVLLALLHDAQGGAPC